MFTQYVVDPVRFMQENHALKKYIQQIYRKEMKICLKLFYLYNLIYKFLLGIKPKVQKLLKIIQ